jgi:hypothetical protein
MNTKNEMVGACSAHGSDENFLLPGSVSTDIHRYGLKDKITMDAESID